jgi:purine-nucleoside phosphorylase
VQEDTHFRAEQVSAAIAVSTGIPTHDVALVLGSGFGSFRRHVEGTVVPYADLPGMPLPAAVGHTGEMIATRLGGNRVLIFSGRAHAYEGHSLDDVVLAVRAAVMSGCRVVVLTNAAGGCGPDQQPGDLVLITDHLNLAGTNPLVGPNDDRLGPRFPDMSEVYSARLRSIAQTVAGETRLGEGIYAWFLGPMYETPAEVRMAQALGAHLVGMSTVPEAIAAHHMGAEVLAMSLVTNLAAGISPTPLSSEEVMETASASASRLIPYLAALLPRL